MNLTTFPKCSFVSFDTLETADLFANTQFGPFGVILHCVCGDDNCYLCGAILDPAKHSKVPPAHTHTD